MIVTNGDVAVEKLQAANIEGHILPWRDVLHDGPVPEEERHERLSQRRAAFIAQEFGVPHDEVALSFAERDAAIRRHRDHERLEVWLEHDLYDQLQLIQILSFLAEENRLEGVFLVQAEDYLGLQPPEALRELAGKASPVTTMQFELACHAWRAFTSPDPAALVQFTAQDSTALPFLRPALLRLLAEFPDPIRGLSLTEERMLRRLEAGPVKAAELFRDVIRQEDARFMGDASFFRRIDGLAFVNEPLLDGVETPSKPVEECEPIERDSGYKAFADSLLRLTPAGRKVLNGRMDHAMTNEVDRWIGGVRLRPALQLRYDRKAGELISPQ
jgi:hypothetical protein